MAGTSHRASIDCDDFGSERYSRVSEDGLLAELAGMTETADQVSHTSDSIAQVPLGRKNSKKGMKPKYSTEEGIAEEDESLDAGQDIPSTRPRRNSKKKKSDRTNQQQPKQTYVPKTALSQSGSSLSSQDCCGGSASAPTSVILHGGEKLEDLEASEESDIPKEVVVNGKTVITYTGHREFSIASSYVPGMRVPAKFYANGKLLELVRDELLNTSADGFIPAVRQLANVATLPGIVGASIGMPDIHAGYGFAIGNVAAMDVDNPEAVISPGGVGFDINCGVRLLRTNLTKADVNLVKQELADAMKNRLPVGVGGNSRVSLSRGDLESVLRDGMEWAVKKNYAWPEDAEVTEEHGHFQDADPSKVSDRAKARAMKQVGTLGSGNHYVEVQVVDEIFDATSAAAMGITEVGQICIMIHSGSRGLGHQVCTDYINVMAQAMREQKISVIDRQLACCRIGSPEGQSYFSAMKCAANYAFCNRSLLAHEIRNTFAAVFDKTPRELGMYQVYDVSHNIAKLESHVVDGQTKSLLVHRKGATRAFGPHSPEIPEKYRESGQPVLVGGSMGTSSYVLTGTEEAMKTTFGSTCHGAGRAMSRSKAMKSLDSKTVLKDLGDKGIAVRVASKHLVAEEAPESYKDVSQVIDTCHEAGISKKCVKLKPLICVKG